MALPVGGVIGLDKGNILRPGFWHSMTCRNLSFGPYALYVLAAHELAISKICTRSNLNSCTSPVMPSSQLKTAGTVHASDNENDNDIE